MSKPVLRNWRQIAADGNSLGVIIGIVSGHSGILGGWMTTAPLVELAEDGRAAVTETRSFELRDPLPDTDPLPETARNAIFARLVRDMPKLNARDLPALFAYIDQISVPPVFAARV